MKLSILFLTLTMAPLLLAADPPCPADPSSLLQGSPWAFQLRSPGLDPVTGTAAVGTFKANPGGTLTATLSVSNANVAVTRRATTSGRYQAYSNCSGGEIMIMLNGFAAQLEFVWAANYTQMVFVADALNPRYGGTAILVGNAKRAPVGCPAGLGNPVNILNATSWTYQLFSGYFPQGGFGGGGSASVGLFRPVAVGNTGILSSVETSVAENGLTDTTTVNRLQNLGGRYLIYDDCSGGEVMLMNRRPGSLQLEFVFAGANFDEMFFLADDSSDPGDVSIVGSALRY